MWLEDHKWHYDYARLAWDAGFTFGKCKYANSDKSKIYLVDIDRIIKERDFSSVERHIPTVLQYVLEGDQAEILDTNFVNLFRLSQLSVEYLIFCKKYLDHTVTILKKDITKLKQEIRQLKSYTEELETHISVLTKNNLVATFKCGKCSKAFSTEEYLNSHLKRRHDEGDKSSPKIEAEKLQMEIKELKERLNNTEKQIQEGSDDVESDKLRDDELGASKLINEIQRNFDRFREQVENKIESLHTEKKIYDDKYDKLFNVVLDYKSKEENQKKQDEVKNESEMAKEKYSEFKESTTQTDKPPARLHIETVHYKNQYEFKEPVDEELPMEVDNTDHEILEKKMNIFGETIENKISTGLFNIENQMQAFWEKLSKLESNQQKVTEHEHPDQSQHIMSLTARNPQIDEEKPKIKPRTKFSKPTTLPKTLDNAQEVEKIRLELGAILSKPKKKQMPKMVQPAVSTMYESSVSETENDSESVGKDPSYIIDDFKEGVTIVDGMKVSKPNETKNNDDRKTKPLEKGVITVRKSNPVKKSLVSTKKEKPMNNSLLKEKFQKDMTDILYSRLQEMGISPNWKGIPKKTFERALEIVEHQASLSKKLLPNYDSVKKSIEKSLGADRTLNKKAVETRRAYNQATKPKKEKANVIKIRYKKKTEEKESLPIVTIKNRSMYDTDTESEAAGDHILSPTKEFEKKQAAVIEELKFLQSKPTSTKTADTDSDLNSTILLSDDKITVETKSAMKSYPSDGSLVKKKVLFDIEGTMANKATVREGGSTSDVTRPMKIEVNANAESSFSDFEIH